MLRAVEARSERQPGAAEELCRSRPRPNSWRSRRHGSPPWPSASSAPARRMAMAEDRRRSSAPRHRHGRLRLGVRRAEIERTQGRQRFARFEAQARRARRRSAARSGQRRLHSPSVPARGLSEMRRTASHGNGKIIGQQGRCLIGADQERAVELAAFTIVESEIELSPRASTATAKGVPLADRAARQRRPAPSR